MTKPVAEQIDQLAREMGVSSEPSDAYILGTGEAPEVAAEAEPMAAPAAPATKYPATETRRPLNQQPLAPAAQQARAPEKKRGWGFFGRHKTPSDLRSEPVADAPAPTPITQPRATAQTMTRSVQADPAVQQPGSSDDLFPDHTRDEQSEIPAFLRRQAN